MATAATSDVLDNVVSLCKRRGFVFPCGEIYGGTRSAWDYGPLGVELKENIKRQWWRSMVTARDDVVGLDSCVILPTQDLGGLRPPRDVHRPADRVPVLPQAVPRRPPAGGRTPRRRASTTPTRSTSPTSAVPQLRHPRRLDRAAPVQHDAQDLPRRDRGRVRPALPAARDRAGHLPQLRQRHELRAQEAAVRHRPDGQELPQRDHARQLHLPHPRVRADGDGVLRQAGRGRGVAPVLDRRAHPLVRRPRHRPDNLRHYEHPQEKLSHYSKRTVDIEYRFGFSGRGVGRARGHRQPHRLRPQAAQRVLRPGPLVLRPGHRRALHALRHRAGGRPQPLDDGVPHRRLHRGRGAQHQGRRRQAHRAPARPAARAGQGRGAAAVAATPTCRRRPRTWPPSCAASAGTSTSTTPARSAAATAARTRSARRTA